MSDYTYIAYADSYDVLRDGELVGEIRKSQGTANHFFFSDAEGMMLTDEDRQEIRDKMGRLRSEHSVRRRIR